MKELIVTSKLASISIPMTFIALYFGESIYRISFILLALLFYPGMSIGDYLAFNHQGLNNYLILSVIYIVQYLYFFIVILSSRYLINRIFKESSQTT